jgi:hypothetical protein
MRKEDVTDKWIRKSVRHKNASVFSSCYYQFFIARLNQENGTGLIKNVLRGNYFFTSNTQMPGCITGQLVIGLNREVSFANTAPKQEDKGTTMSKNTV